ncbi:MAG TPA: phage holin family protein [Vicinamibacteria bacterium]|nr:phage holin family protein [Vicinamibacteria bacterium]
MRILLGIVANAIALYATTRVVPGISWTGGLVGLLIAGALFGLLNLVVRPLAMLLSLPFIVLTLGLFYFVVNGALLLLFSWLMPAYQVHGLWAGILGSLVIMVVNWLIHAVLGPAKS